MRRPSVESPIEQRLNARDEIKSLAEKLMETTDRNKANEIGKALTEMGKGTISDEDEKSIIEEVKNKAGEVAATEMSETMHRIKETTLEEKKEKDTFLARLLKYIPADLIAAFIAIAAAITTISNEPTATYGPVILKVSAIVFVLITFFWVLFGSETPEGKRPRLKWFNASVATIAFAVWITALYGKRVIWPDWPEALGTVLIIASVVAIALAEQVRAWVAVRFIRIEPEMQPGGSSSKVSDS
jgi:uncharacterized membrane-anchored protein